MQIIALIISSVAFVVSVVVAAILKRKLEEAERTSSVYEKELKETARQGADISKKISDLEKEKENSKKREEEFKKSMLAVVKEKMEAQALQNQIAAKNISNSLGVMVKAVQDSLGQAVFRPTNEQMSDSKPESDSKRAEEGFPPPS